MNKGHPEYGCFIAREKTLTNFDHRVGDISQLSLSTVMHPDRKREFFSPDSLADFLTRVR